MEIKKKISVKLIIILLAVIAAIILGLKIFKKDGAAAYKTELPKTATIVEKVEASGTINPVTQTSVGTQVSGIIEKIFVDFNSTVKAGDTLAIIDPSTYESNVLQQEANLQKTESVFTNSKRNYERYQKLYKDNLVAKSELDDAEMDYQSAKAQVTQAQASLDKAKIDLGYTTIVSPVNGIVISKEVEAGQTVAASFQTPTLFLVAEDLTKMQIEVNISEADISKIKEGQSVEFSVDAYPTTTFKGVVSQVRNSPTTISNVVTYKVIVAVDNTDLKLKPGMTANVSIISARKENVLTVANQALRFVPPTGAKIQGVKEGQRALYKGQGVWVEEDGELKRIEVQTGLTDGNRTEITSGDLTTKRPIILSVDLDGKGGSSRRRPMAPGF
ncbi:MAG: efflux RND transporter periplasmic adaptor subunit [Elusimicrobiota bacterium]|jgi:HlyD family secretion protein|nr:efflux RND transporter periplasmic adaptor subunit [Elusimicrobiota bacterium]